MTIQELKTNIENGVVDASGYIFIYKERFLVDQYVTKIAEINNLTIEYVDGIQQNMFSSIPRNILQVFSCDKYDGPIVDGVIILTKESENECAIEFPKLESWQIKDYLYGVCIGVDDHDLDKFLVYNDLYRLQNEIDKFLIFDPKIRGSILHQFFEDGMFEGLLSVEPFDFIKSIQECNIKKIARDFMYVNLDAFSLIGLLIKQFGNMVTVCLQTNPTAQNTDLSDKQIWAIKNVGKRYSKNQILNVYKFLLGIDFRIKSGELSTDNLFDYVLFNVLHLLGGN